MKKSLIEHSQTNYRSEDSTLDVINAGSLQRIAIATEKMASNYTALQKDLDWYKKAYREKNGKIERLNKQIAAYKGVITKLRKKAS